MYTIPNSANEAIHSKNIEPVALRDGHLHLRPPNIMSSFANFWAFVLSSRNLELNSSTEQKYCLAKYWNFGRLFVCVTGGQWPCSSTVRAIWALVRLEIGKLYSLVNASLTGAARYDRQPPAHMREQPCNQELLDHVKTASFKKKRQIRERHAFLASYEENRIFFIGSHVQTLLKA